MHILLKYTSHKNKYYCLVVNIPRGLITPLQQLCFNVFGYFVDSLWCVCCGARRKRNLWNLLNCSLQEFTALAADRINSSPMVKGFLALAIHGFLSKKIQRLILQCRVLGLRVLKQFCFTVPFDSLSPHVMQRESFWIFLAVGKLGFKGT